MILIRTALFLSFLVFTTSVRAAPIAFEPYGFLKTTILRSEHALNSFGAGTFQAPTETANFDLPAANTDPSFLNRAFMSFQIAQSRVGAAIKTGERVSAKLEVDFLDLSRGNAIGVTGPRLRLAELYYKPIDSIAVRVGQGWSTFYAIGPHTANFVGNGFRAGSSGFLNEQVEVKWTYGAFQFFGTLAQKGRIAAFNAKTADTAHEESELGGPAIVLKAEWSDANQKAGLAFAHAEIDNAVSTSAPTPAGLASSDSVLTGGKVYYLGKLNKFEFRGEYMVGQNLNDLNFLTLAQRSVAANNVDNVPEHSFFVSLKYTIDETQNVYGGYGRDDIEASFDTLKPGALVSNEVGRLGYQAQLGDGLVFLTELSHFASRYLTTGATREGIRNAFLGEMGFILNF